MANDQIKNIAVVFSGGLSRGSIQLAFANEVIKKIGYERICVISGASIGALNAYAASVDNIEELLDFYWNLDCDNTRHFMSKIRHDLFNKVFNKVEGQQLTIPTYVNGTKISGLECQYFCLNSMPREDVKNAINMSMSFPIINGPLKFNKHYWIDGGATDNFPVAPTVYFDPDMVIVFHCYPKYYPPTELFEKLKPGAIVIDVDVTLSLPKKVTSFTLSKDKFQSMITEGKKQGKEFADFIFSDFEMNKVRERCFEYINKNIEPRYIKSGDGLMGLVDVLNALYVLKENNV